MTNIQKATYDADLYFVYHQGTKFQIKQGICSCGNANCRHLEILHNVLSAPFYDPFEQKNYDMEELNAIRYKKPLFRFAMAEYRRQQFHKQHPSAIGFIKFYAQVQVVCLDEMYGE
jgi:hypothetical protein